jgi:hypothetical protein
VLKMDGERPVREDLSRQFRLVAEGG